jgi:putative PIG3 family NAD(P)H quinone oxidoreductase
MKTTAVRIRGKGDVDVLALDDFEVRAPGPGELLVQVKAAGLNRADILQRKGFYPAPPGAPVDVPGLEYAGTVSAVGEGVTGWQPGAPVMGIVGGGGMATHLVVHEREAIRVPEGMGLTEAAAIPEVFLTAYDAFLQAGLSAGELVLVHAAGSGVGTAAVQLAATAGAHVIGTSRTADKLSGARALGMHEGILVDGGRFADKLGALAKGRLADVIVDGVGAAYLAENAKALAPRGRLVVIGLLGGATAEMPLGDFLRKRLTLIGTVLRSRPLEEKAILAQRFQREVVPRFERGQLKPVIDVVMHMRDVREAHRRMEQNESFGKIVLVWD